MDPPPTSLPRIQLPFPETATAFTHSTTNISQSTDFFVIDILNCPSAAAASKLISQSWFRSTICKKFPSVIGIKLKINDNFIASQAEKPKSHEFEEKAKILVAFESPSGDESVVYWRNEKGGNFWCLCAEGDCGFDDSDDFGDFVVEFIVGSLRGNESGEFYFNDY